MSNTKAETYKVSGNNALYIETNKYKSVSGQLSIAIDRCGAECPVHEALRLKKEYNIKLANYTYEIEREALKLRIAEFVKSLCNSLPKQSNNQIKSKDVWEALRSSTDSGGSDSFANTLLKKEIDKINDYRNKAKQELESAAEELIKLLKDESFKKHLEQKHIKDKSKKNYLYINPEDAQECYDVSDGKNKEKVREIDHLMAFLTEGLFAADEGNEFLEELIDNSKYTKVAGFDDIWGFITKSKTLIENGTVCIEPLGKIFYNVLPVIKNKIDKLILQDGKGSIDDVLNASELQGIFNFLNSKLDADVKGFIKTRAEFFGGKASQAIGDKIAGDAWKDVLKDWQDPFSNNYDSSFTQAVKKHDDIKKLEGAWFSLSFDIISFSASIAKIASDFKSSKFTDWCSALGDLSGLASNAIETYGTSLSKKSIESFGDDALKVGLKAEKALQVAKVFGVTAGIFSAVVSVISTTDRAKQGDVDAAMGNAIGTCIAVGGIYAAIIGASLATGILAVAGVIVGIWTSIVTDLPIITFLKNLYWGTNWPSNMNEYSRDPNKKNLIPIPDTMKEYYKMHTIRVSFENIYNKKDTSCIRIDSSLLSSDVPVFIEVIPKKTTKQILNQKIIIPSGKDVEGKGEFVLNISSPLATPSLRIYKYWEIWKIDTILKYDINVGIDPIMENQPKTGKKIISKMIINNKKSDVSFKV